MPSTYTPNLGFEKVEPGEQTGTWGGTLNTNFDLIGEAITGIGTVSLPAPGTSGAPNQLLIQDGTSSDARNALITFTDGGGVTADAYVQYGPSDSEKLMWVKNDMGNGYSIIFFQGTYNAGRATIIPDGDTALIMFTGQGASASYASLVMSSVVLAGFKLPNNTAIQWDNAAGDNTLDMKLDASDDLVLTLDGTDILQFNSSVGLYDFKANDIGTTGDLNVAGITATGSITGSNLSGTNTGDEPTFAGSTEGLVPLSVGGTVNYLRADGTWAAPPGDGFTSPVTTKGDLFTYTTGDARIGVGSNGQVLSANSATSTGLEWITISSGGLGNIVEDTSPQLGADLDSNDFDINMTNRSGVKFWETGGGPSTGNYMEVRAASSMSANYVLTLPTTDGVSGQFLKTDGVGNLSWDSPSAGSEAAIYMNGTIETLHVSASATDIRNLIGAGTGDGDITSVTINAGEGLTGGGTDSSGTVNLTVNMGTPSTLSGSTTNATTASGHTHEVTFDRIQTSITSGTTLYPLLTDQNSAGERIPYFDSSFIFNASSGNFQCTSITTTGGISAGSAGISTTGTVSGATLNATSARHLKDEVPLLINTDNLRYLNSIGYILKDDEENRVQMGYFADEVEALFPEIVSHDDEGRAAGIDYSRLVVPLIEKVNALEVEIMELRAMCG